MSSIYKKGRDGYYYYQTYVYNPESKKKDKRVFHALGTKDSIEAKTKQYELDLQYENKSSIDSNSIKSSMNFGLRSTLAIIVGTIAITILLIDYFSPENVTPNTSDFNITHKAVIIDKNIDVIPKAVEPVKTIINEQAVPLIKNIPDKINTNTGSKIVESKGIIPQYNIERIDTLSSAFDQGKVYVTIDEKSSNESQRLLCKELMKSFSEFSNIVICLYANNRAGKDLAKGNDENVSIEEQKQFWLAMYTYNSVEGEYFDDNPSGYLGIN
tara:strand:- start:183 stop:992 length:810 start_codon:yes stop_codon:yes gene_type:complete